MRLGERPQTPLEQFARCFLSVQPLLISTRRRVLPIFLKKEGCFCCLFCTFFFCLVLLRRDTRINYFLSVFVSVVVNKVVRE